MAQEVRDPTGQAWRVGRRWLPWRLRRRDPDLVDDLPGGADADDVVLAAVLFVLFVVIALVAPWLLAGVVLALELLVLVVLLPLFVLLRLGRVARWPLEVWRVGPDGRTLAHAEAVRGWAASRLRLQELLDDVARGRQPGPRHRAD